MIRRSIMQLARANLAYRQASRFSTNSNNQKPTEQRKQKLNENQYKDEEQQEQYKPIEQNRNTLGWWIWRLLTWGSIGLFGYNYYLVTYQNQDGKAQQKTGALPGFFPAAKWTYKQYNDMRQFFSQPPVKKLLGDPLHPLMHPKTLVLNLSGTLIDTQYVFGKGMIFQRRPGLEKFLQRLSQMYEVILFSDDEYLFLVQALPLLDPRQQIFMGFFGKQCMVWNEGGYIKDLKYLNRQPRNIVVIDKNINNIKKHPKNAIILKEFHGQTDDNELIKLLPLLQKLSAPEVRDVRPVLQSLGPNPHEKFYQTYKAKQQKLKQTKSTGIWGWLKGSK